MAKTDKYKGRKSAFTYQKRVNTFFSNKEVEDYFLSQVDIANGKSLRLVLHNALNDYYNAKKK